MLTQEDKDWLTKKLSHWECPVFKAETIVFLNELAGAWKKAKSVALGVIVTAVIGFCVYSVVEAFRAGRPIPGIEASR